MLQQLATALSLCFILVACSSAEDTAPATHAECTSVQKHLASLRMKNVRKNSKITPADLDKHQEQFAQVTEAYLDKCAEDRTHAWVTCMLKLEALGNAKDCE